MYTRIHKELPTIHANTPPHSPDTHADRLWGQLLSYCVTLALAQGPAQFNTMTSPCGRTSPPAVNKATHHELCVCVCMCTGECVRDKERRRMWAFVL